MIPRQCSSVSAVIALSLLALSALAAGPAAQERTLTGRVDGQKFGTNLVGDGASVTFQADSVGEKRLLEACDVGLRCKVVVVTDKSDVVVRLVSAVRASESPIGGAQSRPTSAPGPSFSCAKAGTGAERLICDDANLASLDREVALAYKQKLEAAAAERARLQSDQRAWIRGKRDTCADTECLRAVYRERLKMLNR